MAYIQLSYVRCSVKGAVWQTDNQSPLELPSAAFEQWMLSAPSARGESRTVITPNSLISPTLSAAVAFIKSHNCIGLTCSFIHFGCVCGTLALGLSQSIKADWRDVCQTLRPDYEVPGVCSLGITYTYSLENMMKHYYSEYGPRFTTMV